MKITFINKDFASEIDRFKCSDEEVVELFLKEQALKLHETNIVRTRLLIDDENDNNIIGYFSLFSDHVTIPKSKREQHNWDMFSVLGKSMYPAIRLHYLGVDERYRKNGYGETLLYYALDICKEISEEIGCNFVSIEALSNSVSFYERYDFYLLNKQNQHLTNMIFKLDELD